MDTYIGYSVDSKIRYKSTSGGIGTAIIKYLFESKKINTSVSFEFNQCTLQYEPRLIYDYQDYRPVGSIYHEIDLVGFTKKNINNIIGNFACFTTPCQTKVIRTIVEGAGHGCIIIGLTCSSQQSIDATMYLLDRLKINKDDVIDLQYRGNGWPSGIQISLNNKEKLFIDNNHSLWTQIFHSRLFILPRCFYCKDTLNEFADISLADPWQITTIPDIKLGYSLVWGNTNVGSQIIGMLRHDNYAILNSIDASSIEKSQNATIERKKRYRKNSRKTHILGG